MSKYAVNKLLTFIKNSTIFINGKKICTRVGVDRWYVKTFGFKARDSVFQKSPNRYRSGFNTAAVLTTHFRTFHNTMCKNSRKSPAIVKNENERTFLLCSTKKTNIDTEFCIEVYLSSFREGYFLKFFFSNTWKIRGFFSRHNSYIYCIVIYQSDNNIKTNIKTVFGQYKYET